MSFLERYKVNKKAGRYYKVYNEKGEFLYNIDREQEKNLTNEYLKGVTCFVINPNGEVLIEQRGNTELTPRMLDLVSGHIDNEEIGMQAMIRELREEVGISEQEARNVCKICTQAFKLGSGEKTRNFFVEIYYLLYNSSQAIADNKEVAEIKWLPMEEVFEMIKNGETKFPKSSKEVQYDPIFNIIRQAYLEKAEEERNPER